ncbi:MAG: DUF389 domain-containing protein [Candidatus Bathyarchaeota archaeon]|nr:DUF389 domain-containing protein [Candidatus Bathyarchaeota archaeon]
MRVCCVKNFYLNLEHLCEEGAEFTFGFFGLVVVAALLATGGLISNSIPVIIGSMLVAPFLSPSRAVALGGIFRKWKTVGRGLAKQLTGLLAVGSVLGFFVTLGFLRIAPEITVTPEVIARMLPTLTSVYLAVFVALASGAAASLALIASPRIISDTWHQLLDVMIGAEIAVSLIPPAAVVGIGLAFGLADMAIQSLSLLIINLVCLNIFSIPVLYLRGVGLEPLRIEKKIRDVAEKTVKDVSEEDGIFIEIILHCDETADVFVRLQTTGIDNDVVPLLARRISEDIKKETGFSNNVEVTTVPVSTYSS